jgi:hypothetical protein
VYVLREVHRSLRPAGVLLDLHPEPEFPIVEIVRDGSEATSIGNVDTTALIGKIHAARAALASAVQARWFDRQRELVFEFVSHFASVEEWLAHRKARRSTGLIDEALLERARALLASPRRGTLVVRERVRATRFRRNPAPDGTMEAPNT